VQQISDLPYFHTWCGFSVNLRCRSETCCTRFTENAGCKKSRHKSSSGHHCTTLSGYIFANKAHVDTQKKIVKQQYVLHMSPWSRYGIGQTIIFSCCDLFFLLCFFSSSNFSRRRLDVCHTSTHGVALVRILDAALKR